jgi:hypothetical protein
MLEGRSMFIWRLEPVAEAELGAKRLAEKASRAHLSSVWIKVAVGASPHANVSYKGFEAVLEALAKREVNVWGWSEPRCATAQRASEEAELAAELVAKYRLGGLVMDAERPEGGSYFHGGPKEASAYASGLRKLLDAEGKGLAICSHDIPQNFAPFPFATFAKSAHVNAPQVYYGSSPSVDNRLSRAIKANADVGLPFVPIGAAWIGDGGGCASASAVVERGGVFMDLVQKKGFQGYGFWHWAGAPLGFWKLLYDTPV